ncbi:MAG: GGDEF domain-containing protein [Desulfobacteraceae bacterium]|nr:GGDEF domain-containing protein [Desulfobacteraceae bacterium]
MNTAFEKLEYIFRKGKNLSQKDLVSLFDAAGIPQESCWHAVYKIIFDTKINLNSNLYGEITKSQLKPIMKKALKNAQKAIFTEEALLSLIKDYNTISFSVYNSQLTDILNELDNLTNEFQSMSAIRQQKVEDLETEAILAIKSNLSIEDKIKLIKYKFKETINMFQQDILKLDQMNNTDHLTTLYNRRFFDEQLKTEVTQALKEKTWLNLLMIDIDDFKLFNDTYGHVVGDQALKTIAKNIQLVCHDESRKTRIAFFPTRYGGEEFAVILPAISENKVFKIAELILTKTSNYSFIIRNKKGKIKYKDLNLTVSIGIAALNHMDDKKRGIKALIKNADAAMYDAKKAGKNCIKEIDL